MNVNDLGKSQVIITIDMSNETYTLDVQHCSLSIMYYILRSIIERIEDGDLLDGNLNAMDANGNAVSAEKMRKIIEEIKEEFEKKEVKPTVKIVDSPKGSGFNN